mgnify:CR=1 FL=1
MQIAQMPSITIFRFMVAALCLYFLALTISNIAACPAKVFKTPGFKLILARFWGLSEAMFFMCLATALYFFYLKGPEYLGGLYVALGFLSLFVLSCLPRLLFWLKREWFS